ncbi:MAG: XdhC family protein [Planctomycetes bacterium]|nr:XdhC family protein [Planctomycetota bacterium]
MLQTVFNRTAQLLAANRRFALIHLVKVKGSSPGKQGFKMLVAADGERVGTIGGGDAEFQMVKLALNALAEGRSRSVQYELTTRPGNLVASLCGGTNEVFIEVFMEKPCLLLLGAGHVARAVASLCRQLEYPYVVVDDRAEYAVKADFPGALEVVWARPSKYLGRNDLPAITHVVGLGYNGSFDLDGLIPALVKLPNARLGAIGSKAKFAKMTETALKSGATREHWSRVKCPVGLAIGAQTPAEIAIAIMAEVIGGGASRPQADNR